MEPNEKMEPAVKPAVKRTTLDAFAIDLTASFAKDWLTDLQRSPSTLAALFHNSALSTKHLRRMLSCCEWSLNIPPSTGKPLAQRLVTVSEAAAARGIPLKKDWQDILPQLRAVAALPQSNKWKSAKGARAVLRGFGSQA